MAVPRLIAAQQQKTFQQLWNRTHVPSDRNRAAPRLNSISPEILVGQIWLQEDEPTSVEIIELNTSGELNPSKHDGSKQNNDNHNWSFAGTNTQLEDDYKINEKARERRRMKQDNDFFSKNTSTNTSSYLNNFYPDIGENYIDDNNFLNHQVNCFTIINKHLLNSDTSSEGELADMEIITSNDITEPMLNDWSSRNNCFGEEIITYDPDLDNDTRTIWIYSFKNKHLLAENDYEFTKLMTKENSSGSTSCSAESDEDRAKKDKGTNVHRLGSPIPPAYIPRLNLAPTLSTVTEVSEPTKQSSPTGSNKSPKNKFQKPRNGWFANDTEKIDNDKSVPKLEKSTNVVNWMALSPREERRRPKGSVNNWDRTVIEAIQCEKNPDSAEHQRNVLQKDKPFKLQVDVDVHVSVNEKSPEKKYLGTPKSIDANVQTYDDNKSSKDDIKHIDEEYKECTQDRGDHDMSLQTTQKVLYQINPMVNRAVSNQDLFEEPSGQINNETWVCESRDEKETSSFNYVTDKKESNTDNTWLKNNMPLLKPSHWNEYLPITDSPLSLHLSLGSIIEERQPWFKRFLKYMNCCK